MPHSPPPSLLLYPLLHLLYLFHLSPSFPQNPRPLLFCSPHTPTPASSPLPHHLPKDAASPFPPAAPPTAPPSFPPCKTGPAGCPEAPSPTHSPRSPAPSPSAAPPESQNTDPQGITPQSPGAAAYDCNTAPNAGSSP